MSNVKILFGIQFDPSYLFRFPQIKGKYPNVHILTLLFGYSNYLYDIHAIHTYKYR